MRFAHTTYNEIKAKTPNNTIPYIGDNFLINTSITKLGFTVQRYYKNHIML